MQRTLAPVLALSLLSACQATSADVVAPATPTYPETARVEQTDEFFGQTVHDPYRWLENDVREDDAVRAWVTAQNEVTFAYLEDLPRRAALRERLEQMYSYERFSTPTKSGDHYYHWENDGLQLQSVLYRAAEPYGEAEIVIDPNTWSEDGTAAFAGGEYSDDGRYLAYGRSDAGSDWAIWRVLDLQSGEHVGGALEWIKFSGVTWLPDGTGFFYSAYDAPEEGAEFQAANVNQKVYLHTVGTEQADDRLIYSRPDQPTWSFSPLLSDDGRYLVIHVWESGTPNLVHVLDLTQPEPNALELVDAFDASYSCIGGSGTTLVFETNADAPLGQIREVDLRNPASPAWRTLVPERDATIETSTLVGAGIAVSYLVDASTRFELFDRDGTPRGGIELPGIGSAAGLEGEPDDTETYYSFSSFATPSSVYRYDFETGLSSVVRETELPFDASEYTVTQVFYESKDGTRVPMFLAHHQDLVPDGNLPVLLYGYGGFNISLTPSFSVTRLAWMEMGGVFAMPNLRGGGEYGEDWHTAGTKTTKQNTFDDFIAAAEWLLDNGYTNSSRLAIQGGSNGGLLVGACMTQRPELFGACLPAVGVMDMLRFHLFTAGRYWVFDYGSVEVEEEYRALRAYSPYHNVEVGQCYPPTLVTTADTDDRVVPGHSFKFAARLQEAQDCFNPVLIRIETSAGHGRGKPITKRIEEAADAWAFLAYHLGMDD